MNFDKINVKFIKVDIKIRANIKQDEYNRKSGNINIYVFKPNPLCYYQQSMNFKTSL